MACARWGGRRPPLRTLRVENHLIQRRTAGHHRQDLLLAGDLELHDYRPFRGKALLDYRLDFVCFGCLKTLGAIGLGQLDEVNGQVQTGLRVPLVEEELLPLTHHTEKTVVEDDYFHRQTVLDQCRHLLDVHLYAAVTADGNDLPARESSLRPHGCRKTVAHCPETS